MPRDKRPRETVQLQIDWRNRRERDVLDRVKELKQRKQFKPTFLKLIELDARLEDGDITALYELYPKAMGQVHDELADRWAARGNGARQAQPALPPPTQSKEPPPKKIKQSKGGAAAKFKQGLSAFK